MTKLVQLKQSEIAEEVKACPYCMNEQSRFSCCGEMHFEDAVITIDNELYLETEYEIIPEGKNESNKL